MTIFGFGLEHDPTDSISQSGHIDVDEQGNRILRQLQICEDSGEVNSFNSLNRLEFQHHYVIDDHINSVAALHIYAAIYHRNLFLPLNGQSTLNQLIAQARLIGRFQQPGSEFPVHVDRRAHDRPRNIARFHSVPSVPSVVNELSEVCLAVTREECPETPFSCPSRTSDVEV